MRGLPGQLVGFLSKDKTWFPKGTLTADIVWKHQSGESYGKRYLPETVGRALRSLEEQGVIAVKQDGISVQYKWLPHDLRLRYVPSSMRQKGKEDKLFRDVEK